MQDETITTSKIAEEAVTSSKMASMSVEARHLQENIINGLHIKPGAITSEHLAQGSINIGIFADRSLEGSKLVENRSLLKHLLKELLQKRSWQTERLEPSICRLNPYRTWVLQDRAVTTRKLETKR